MIILTLFCMLSPPAAAHGAMGPALTPAILALSEAQYRPLAGERIAAAVAALDVGIAYAADAATSCATDLFPAAVRAGSAEQRAVYDRAYRAFMKDYARALTAHRDEFAAQAARPGERREIARLVEQARRIKELANRAHRELRALSRAP